MCDAKIIVRALAFADLLAKRKGCRNSKSKSAY